MQNANNSAVMNADKVQVYLDWNATTPAHPDVIAAMANAQSYAWGNPSSVHGHGAKARRELERARSAVATLAGLDVRDVVFTSGGTEANNAALRSMVQRGARTLLTSRLEHPSVTATALALEREEKISLRWINVTPAGLLDLDDLRAALGATSQAIVALQAVNQETGILQPLDEVFVLARSVGALVHVDTVQAFGRIEGQWLEADTRVIAAHKLRGPKGVGALLIRAGMTLEPFLRGGAQEQGLRAGTLDGVAAAGFAVAATRAVNGPARYALLAPLRDRLEQAIVEMAGSRVQKVGRGARAPHVCNLTFRGVRGPELVAALDLAGVSVSAGSACSAGTVEPSPVVTAMLGSEAAAGALRISLGEDTTAGDIDGAEAIFRKVLPRFW